MKRAWWRPLWINTPLVQCISLSNSSLSLNPLEGNCNILIIYIYTMKRAVIIAKLINYIRSYQHSIKDHETGRDKKILFFHHWPKWSTQRCQSQKEWTIHLLTLVHIKEPLTFTCHCRHLMFIFCFCDPISIAQWCIKEQNVIRFLYLAPFKSMCFIFLSDLMNWYTLWCAAIFIWEGEAYWWSIEQEEWWIMELIGMKGMVYVVIWRENLIWTITLLEDQRKCGVPR